MATCRIFGCIQRPGCQVEAANWDNSIEVSQPVRCRILWPGFCRMLKMHKIQNTTTISNTTSCSQKWMPAAQTILCCIHIVSTTCVKRHTYDANPSSLSWPVSQPNSPVPVEPSTSLELATKTTFQYSENKQHTPTGSCARGIVFNLSINESKRIFQA